MVSTSISVQDRCSILCNSLICRCQASCSRSDRPMLSHSERVHSMRVSSHLRVVRVMIIVSSSHGLGLVVENDVEVKLAVDVRETRCTGRLSVVVDRKMFAGARSRRISRVCGGILFAWFVFIREIWGMTTPLKRWHVSISMYGTSRSNAHRRIQNRESAPASAR